MSAIKAFYLQSNCQQLMYNIYFVHASSVCRYILPLTTISLKDKIVLFFTGFFLEPAVFTDVTDDMFIAKEESFGPVMIISKFKQK